MTNSHYRVLTLALTCLVAASCGGGARSSGPLQLRLSERYIAAVPISEHGPIMDAEEDLSLARRELARARLDYEQSKTSKDIAGISLQQAELATRAARTRLRAARSRANLAEIRAAERDLTIAIADQEAARARYEEMTANRVFLKAELAHRRSKARAMEARVELEKARLAAEYQIQPKGFSLGEYERQFHDRMIAARSAELAANEKRTAASRAHRRWVSLNDQASRNLRPPGLVAPPPGEPAPFLESAPPEDMPPPQAPDDRDEPESRPPATAPGPG